MYIANASNPFDSPSSDSGVADLAYLQKTGLVRICETNKSLQIIISRGKGISVKVFGDHVVFVVKPVHLPDSFPYDKFSDKGEFFSDQVFSGDQALIYEVKHYTEKKMLHNSPITYISDDTNFLLVEIPWVLSNKIVEFE